jgi:MFS family permease
MRGRIWAGILGAIGAFIISGATAFFSPCCGLIGLAVTIGGAAVIGYIVNQVDEDVKANPDKATNAGAIAGLITGIGGAAGQVLGAAVVSAIMAANPEAFEEVIRSFNAEGGFTIDVDMMGQFYVAVGICIGVISVGMSVAAGAITARMSMRSIRPYTLDPTPPQALDQPPAAEEAPAALEPPPDDDAPEE